MTNHIDPSQENFAKFKAEQGDGPIQMLNLVKFKDQADYADGTKLSGAAAYGVYIQKAGTFVAKAGAKVIWKGKPQVTLIGPAGSEDWDAAFIVQYPSAAAFVAMVQDPDYQAITHHRTAATENSRLVRMQPLDL